MAYTLTSGDVETGLGERTVVVVEKRSSVGWVWKLSVGILIVALCAICALFFAWYWNGRPAVLVQEDEGVAFTERQTGVITDHRHTLKKIGSNAKAAIHLEGSYDDGNVFKDQVEWRKDQGQTFALGGFRLQSNQITIPHTGLYFVYSQASFRLSCSGGGSGVAAATQFSSLSHGIWRYSDSIGTNVSLMSAVRSACQRIDGDGEGSRAGQGVYNAIYIGAVFQLKKGDRLWTETNHLKDLESEEGKTFFGAVGL